MTSSTTHQHHGAQAAGPRREPAANGGLDSARLPAPASGAWSGSPRQLQQGRRIAQCQGLAAGESPAGAMALAGTLGPGQVSHEPVEQALPAQEVHRLAQGLRGAGKPGQRPLARGVADGSLEVSGGKVILPSLSRPGASGTGLASGIRGLSPQATRLSVQGDRFQVQAKMNPWIQVAGGKITHVDNGPHNKSMGPGWTFYKKSVLESQGVDTSVSLIGQSFGPGGTTSMTPSGGFTVPSATFDPSAQTSSFHVLPHSLLPPVPPGYTWTGGGSSSTPYIPMRDPVVCPTSPGFNVDSEDVGSSTVCTSYISDPSSSGGTQVLGGMFQVQPGGNHFTGPRDYPMTSKDYKHSVTHQTLGRGHVVDHAEGSQSTTSSSHNYVPENTAFNEGARNHLVRGMRPTGGAVLVSYDYSATPDRTMDGTAIPDREHFMIQPTGQTAEYYDIPNQTYPNDRKTSAATPYQKPSTSYPFTPWQ